MIPSFQHLVALCLFPFHPVVDPHPQRLPSGQPDVDGEHEDGDGDGQEEQGEHEQQEGREGAVVHGGRLRGHGRSQGGHREVTEVTEGQLVA